MTSPASELAAREGIGRHAGGTVEEVLTRAPWLPSDHGGQDAVAAWARGGPEDGHAVEHAIGDGLAARVWGPHGRLWTTRPDVAGWVRAAFEDLADHLDVDGATVTRLRSSWPDGGAWTVGRAAGALGVRREVVGPALQHGSLRGWWAPTDRDEEGRLRFVLREAGVGPDRDEACARVVAHAVGAGCTGGVLAARLGSASVVDAGLAGAVAAGWVARDGDVLRPTGTSGPAGASGPVPAVPAGPSLLGRGDPFAALAATTPATRGLRRDDQAPPLVLADGRLIGTWSERRVRGSLHLDVTLAETLPTEGAAALEGRVASLGRLRGARRTRWRPIGAPGVAAGAGQ